MCVLNYLAFKPFDLSFSVDLNQDRTDTRRCATHLDLPHESDRKRQLSAIHMYNQRDVFIFLLCNGIPVSPT